MIQKYDTGYPSASDDIIFLTIAKMFTIKEVQMVPVVKIWGQC